MRDEMQDWRREIAALEEEHPRAFVARDVTRLNELWSDELLVNSPINRVHDKQQVLSLLNAGVIAHSSYDATIEAMERRGEIVVVLGSERIVNAPGTPLVHRRFTNVWRREDGAWRLILRHANLTPETNPHG